MLRLFVGKQNVRRLQEIHVQQAYRCYGQLKSKLVTMAAPNEGASPSTPAIFISKENNNENRPFNSKSSKSRRSLFTDLESKTESATVIYANEEQENKSKGWHVYLIISADMRKTYVGVTTNFKRRMAICEEEAKIRAELEKEIEKDLEEEMRENISRLIHKLERLHTHQESNRDQTECPIVRVGGKHLKRPAKIADRKDSEKKFKRVNLDKDFDWVRSLRSGSRRRHELKGKNTFAPSERARKCRSVMTRPLLMSDLGSGPPFRGRHERNSLVFMEDLKAIPAPFGGKGKAMAIPNED